MSSRFKKACLIATNQFSYGLKRKEEKEDRHMLCTYYILQNHSHDLSDDLQTVLTSIHVFKALDFHRN